jgi:hypothetical protein
MTMMATCEECAQLRAEREAFMASGRYETAMRVSKRLSQHVRAAHQDERAAPQQERSR